jgi:hypothetical protein
MARETNLRCDVCRKPTNKIVAKLLLTPSPSVKHSNYTHHADVGECCKDRVIKLFNFRPRMTKEQYQAQRKAG